MCKHSTATTRLAPPTSEASGRGRVVPGRRRSLSAAAALGPVLGKAPASGPHVLTAANHFAAASPRWGAPLRPARFTEKFGSAAALNFATASQCTGHNTPRCLWGPPHPAVAKPLPSSDRGRRCGRGVVMPVGVAGRWSGSTFLIGAKLPPPKVASAGRVAARVEHRCFQQRVTDRFFSVASTSFLNGVQYADAC